jgi:hypothetical protein
MLSAHTIFTQAHNVDASMVVGRIDIGGLGPCADSNTTVLVRLALRVGTTRLSGSSAVELIRRHVVRAAGGVDAHVPSRRAAGRQRDTVVPTTCKRSSVGENTALQVRWICRALPNGVPVALDVGVIQTRPSAVQVEVVARQSPCERSTNTTNRWADGSIEDTGGLK